LQQYWIWLHLLVAIAKVILGCNNLQWCCNCLLVIATRILKWLQYHVPIATVFWVVIIFCGVAIVRYLLQLQS